VASSCVTAFHVQVIRLTWHVVCTGFRFSVACISCTHCFNLLVQVRVTRLYHRFPLFFASCAVGHRGFLTTLFWTPDVSQAHCDFDSEMILPLPNLFQWLLMDSLLRSLDRSSSHLQSSYCTSWYFCMILSSLSRWYERTYIRVFASQVHPYLNRGRNDFQCLALVTQFLACVPGMI